MEDSKQKVGKQIKAIRKERALTQEGLAKLLGVTRVVISDYETGKQNLTLDTIDRIAAALNVEVSILFK